MHFQPRYVVHEERLFVCIFYYYGCCLLTPILLAMFSDITSIYRCGQVSCLLADDLLIYCSNMLRLQITMTLLCLCGYIATNCNAMHLVDVGEEDNNKQRRQ